MTLNAYRDADFLRNYTFASDFSLTDYSARAVIYVALGGTELLEVTTTPNTNDSYIVLSGNVINLLIRKEDIADLPEAANTGEPSILYFDVFLTTPTDTTSKLHGGVFRVWPFGAAVRGASSSTDINVSLDGDEVSLDMDTSSLEDLPVAAFDGALRRTLVDRFPDTIRALGDYPRTSTDLVWINAAITEAAAQSLSIGRRVYLSTEGRALNIGSGTIVMKSGVDLDLTGSTIIHERVNSTNAGSIAMTGTDISNFSVTGGEFYGPGSWLSGSTIYKSLTYAFQFDGCSNFKIKTIYTNGNSGILIQDCTKAEAFLDGYELSGTGIGVKGGSDITVGATVRNASAFCVFGDLSATRVRVLYTTKYYDESKISQGDYPYLWDRRRYSCKVALNPISNIVWSSSNGGQLVITVTRDPTLGTSTIPALVVGNDVFLSRITSTPANAFNNREFEITELTSTTITVACPANPGTYTSSGWVGDMEHTVMCLGLESCGVTESCTDWTIDYLISRNSADAGASLTGDYMKLMGAEVENGTLVGVTLSGIGSYCGPLKTKSLGHWSSAVARIGGVGGRFTPAAGNFPKDCSFAHITSRDDIVGAFEISSASRYAAYSPGGVCEKRLATAESGTPGRLWIFRTYDEVPEFFGTVSPIEYGFVEPDEGDQEEHIWNDGVGGTGTNWTYLDYHIGEISPTAPENCVVQHWSYEGPSTTPYVDRVGPLYGNRYSSQFPAFQGPLIPVNSDGLILPGGGTGTITMSSTPQEWIANWWAARSVGGATVTRIAGTNARYATKVQRTAGNTATNSPYIAVSITGDDLYWFLGKYPSLKMQAWCGANWSDNNAKLSWSMHYLTSVTALDSDLVPSAATDLDSGASDTVSTDASQITITSTMALPTDVLGTPVAQLIIRIFYTPTGTAGADDWWAFEKFCAGPSDSDFMFASEDRNITQLRLDAL